MALASAVTTATFQGDTDLVSSSSGPLTVVGTFKLGLTSGVAPLLYYSLDGGTTRIAVTVTWTPGSDTGTYSFTADLSGLGTITFWSEEEPTGDYPLNTFSYSTAVPTATTPIISSVDDNQPGITGQVSSGGTSNDNSLLISGSAQAGVLIRLYDGSTEIGTATADVNGLWSFNATGLQDGRTYNFRATATNSGGVESAKTAAWVVTIDTTAPNTPTLNAVGDDAGLITGPVANGGVSDDTSLVLSGTADTGTTVRIYDGSALLGEVTATGGAWSFTAENLTNGRTYNFRVTASDSAGNTSGFSSPYVVRIDTSAAGANGAPQITSVVDNVGAIQGDVANGGVSNDTQLVISGTGPANTPLELYAFDGTTRTLVATLTVMPDGTWSVDEATWGSFNLVDGKTYTFTAESTGASGPIVSAGWVVTTDTTAPGAASITSVTDSVGTITGPLSSGATSDDQALLLQGSAEANSTIKVYDGATLIGTVKADGTGAWAYSTSDLTNLAAHSFTVTATDQAGNTGAASTAFTVTTDTTAPGKPSFSVADNAGTVTSSALASGKTTDDSTLVFTGTADAGNEIILYNGSVELDRVNADGSGAWTYTANLNDGTTYRFTAVARNTSSGTLSEASDLFTVTADFTAPTITSTASARSIQENTPADQIVYTAVASDAANGNEQVLSGITYSLAGSDAAKFSIDASTGVVKLIASPDYEAQQQYSFAVVATDSAGNSSSKTVTLNVQNLDEAAPTITSAATATVNEGVANAVVYTVTATDLGDVSNGVTYALKGDGSGDDREFFSIDTLTGQVTINEPAVYSAAGYGFTVVATDAAGNFDEQAVQLSVIDLDLEAPDAPVINTVEGDNSINAVEAADGVVVSGSAEGASSVTVTWGGVTKIVTTSGTASGTGTWTTTFSNLEFPSDGTSLITATARDAAGNVSAAGSQEVLLDRIADDPGAPLTMTVVATDNIINLAEKTAGVTLSGSAEAGAAIAIAWNGTTRTTTADASTGAWSLGYASGQIPADTTTAASVITVTATDKAGNVSTPISRSVVIDTAAPNAPLINTVAGNDIVNAAEKTAGITLSGTGEIGTTAAITWGTYTTSTTVNSSGIWSVIVPSGSVPPDNATSSVSVTLTDAAGNVSSAGTKSVRIDTGAPLAPVINAVAGDNLINAAEKAAGLTLSGTTDAENGSTVAITWGNVTRTTTVNGASWSLGYTSAQIPADAASSTISAVVTDTAGNTSAAGTRSVVIDTVAPALTIAALRFGDAVTGGGSTDTGVIKNDFITSSSTQTLNGTLSAALGAGDTVWVRLNSGGTTGSWSQATAAGTTFSTSLNLGDTDNTGSFDVQVRDAAGNPGATRNQTYRLDTTPAGVTISTFALSADTGISATDLITSSPTQTFSGTLSTNIAAGESVWYRVNSGDWTQASTTTGRNTWSFTGTLSSGANTIAVRHQDIAGNFNPAGISSRTVTLDATAPTLSSLVLASGGADNLYGRGDVVTVTATFSESVLITGTPRVALNVGGVTKYATYTAGNNSNTLTFSYTVAAGDTDANGISLAANALQLNQGTIRDAAGTNALIAVTAKTDQANAAVDSSLPSLSAVAIANGGTQVVLTLSEALLAGSVDPTRFALTNAPAGVTVASANASGNQVTLSLTGGTLTPANAANLAVAYTDPTAGNDSNVIQDAAGNDAATWTAQAATSFASDSSLTLATTTTITTASLTGSTAADLTGNASANTLIGNAGANVITGLGGADRLTGAGGTDTFRYTANGESLLGTGAAFDVITDFNSAQDKIDISRLGATFATSVAAKSLTTTAVTALTQTGISRVLTNSTFAAADAAAVFQFSGNYYLAVNDGNQGFQAATDSIIQLGSTTNPNIIPTAVQVF